MGRSPDTAQQQKAKGNPGRRSAAVKAREARLMKVSELLAPIAGGAEVPPPRYLCEPGFEGALAVWQRLAPELKRTHRLPKDSQDAFAVFCCNFAEWLEAQVDITENGRTQRVKTVAGGFMERDRPAMRHRQQAFDNVFKLSGAFGLTPVDMYSLFKDQKIVAASNPGLFDDMPQKAAPSADEVAADRPRGVIGSAARHKSQPPVH